MLRLTLRLRLTLFYTALMAFLLTVISISVYAALRNNLYDNIEGELERNIEQLTNIASTSTVPAVSDFDPGGYAQVDQIVFTPLNRTNVALGIPFRNSNLSRLGLGARIVLSDDAYGRLERGGDYRGETDLEIDGARLPILVRARFITGSASSAAFVLYTARDLSQLRSTLSELQAILLLVGLFGLLGAGILAYSIAGNALEPIRRVRDTAAEITGSNLGVRVPEPATHDEVADLAKTLNSMLERLEGSFETQRRFTADASHELRTPVTAISGHANYLMRRTNPTPEQKESLEAIRSLSNRLSKLIADLLDLARADAGFPIEPREVNLVSLAEDVHLELAAIAGNTEIEIEGARNLIVMADPNRIKQVILNLVQNAIKAGSTRVRVLVEPDHPRDAAHRDMVRLTIEDNGPGISPEHLPRLFDRFFRVDTARDRAAGGSGLGLSIVKWIAEAHGGTVHVSSRVGLGTRFDVRLPLHKVAKATGMAVSVADDRA